jgi:hypothetical protein
VWTWRRGSGPPWIEVVRQEGATVPWQGASARACQCSPVAVEEDELNEAALEGCSPEHERW